MRKQSLESPSSWKPLSFPLFILRVKTSPAFVSLLTLWPREAGNPNAEVQATGETWSWGLLNTHGSPVQAAQGIFVGICPKLCCSDKGNSVWFCWPSGSVSNWCLPLLPGSWGPAALDAEGKSITWLTGHLPPILPPCRSVIVWCWVESRCWELSGETNSMLDAHPSPWRPRMQCVLSCQNWLIGPWSGRGHCAAGKPHREDCPLSLPKGSLVDQHLPLSDCLWLKQFERSFGR